MTKLLHLFPYDIVDDKSVAFIQLYANEPGLFYSMVYLKINIRSMRGSLPLQDVR